MAFDSKDQRLASGSRDTDVVVWDVVGESGLFRLKGHKGPISRCIFMERRNVLVTASRDTLIKFWDLDIQHCFNTVASHMTEVWDVVLVKEEKYLISGSSDSELRVFRLTFQDGPDPEEELAKHVEPTLKKLRVESRDNADDRDGGDGGDDDGTKDARLLVEKVGSILRAAQDKVSHLVADRSGQLVACHGSDSSVELFLVCGEEEVKRRCQKRAKKERRKMARREEGEASHAEELRPVEPTIGEEFRRLKVAKASGKVRSVDLEVKSQRATLTTLTANNLVEQHSLDLEEKVAQSDLVAQLAQPGHRSDVRTVAFSSDNTAVLSGSQESVKIWSRSAQVSSNSILRRSLLRHS